MRDEGYEVVVKRMVKDWPDDSATKATALVVISQLPPLDYLKTCRLIRKHSAVPILVVRGRSDTVDMVVALETGADDFVAEPYRGAAILARIRALLRRDRLAKSELWWSHLLA
jgi:DNA-binding response OmpR family regulator